jgi:EmrB/QacA subfamily drug resistance transporter
MIIIVIGLMLSIFLASVESTIVATAMPTIVSQIGGIESFSWAFAAYMVASTTMVPLFGKLSDIYGRRSVFLAAMAIFLVGSWLCGIATSMPQLIGYRAIQGLGAGGLLPLVFTIIGDLFTLEQRSKMQGVFSGVWGVSAVVGPLLGGFLVDQVAWQWIFWLNLPLGLVAAALVGMAWVDRPRTVTTRPIIDWAGAGLLTITVVLLLLALLEINNPIGWSLLAGALLAAGGLVLVERRAADPVLPLGLFSDRLFVVACCHGLMSGCAIFGLTSFIPLFAQGVLGATPTAAGAALMPLLLGWVGSSIISGRLILRTTCRILALLGTLFVVVGALPLAWFGAQTTTTILLVTNLLMGIGMGFSIPAFLIAVQSSVARPQLGSATSTLQFSRSIGGALGTALMGVVLVLGLNRRAAEVGLTQAQIDRLLSPEGREVTGATLDSVASAALGSALHGVFVVALATAVLALIASFFTPGGRVADLQQQRLERERIASQGAS